MTYNYHIEFFFQFFFRVRMKIRISLLNSIRKSYVLYKLRRIATIPNRHNRDTDSVGIENCYGRYQEDGRFWAKANSIYLYILITQLDSICFRSEMSEPLSKDRNSF